MVSVGRVTIARSLSSEDAFGNVLAYYVTKGAPAPVKLGLGQAARHLRWKVATDKLVTVRLDLRGNGCSALLRS